MCEQCDKLRAELENVHRQYGTCSVCGFIAWRGANTNTEECQYCKLQKQAAAMREAIEKARAAVARFLVPHKFHLSESWLDFFVEENLVTFDALGFVKAKPIDGDAGQGYVSKEQVLPLVWALESYAGDTWDCEQANTALALAQELGFK